MVLLFPVPILISEVMLLPAVPSNVLFGPAVPVDVESVDAMTHLHCTSDQVKPCTQSPFERHGFLFMPASGVSVPAVPVGDSVDSRMGAVVGERDLTSNVCLDKSTLVGVKVDSLELNFC